MKHDWEKIKTEYITTDISTRKLAEKHHTTQAEIAKRCSKEKWVELRSVHRGRVMSKAVQKAAKSKADVLYNEICALDHLSAAILAATADPLQFQRYIFHEHTDESGRTIVEKVFQKFDSKALKDIVAALEIVVRMKLEITGLLSERDQIMTSIASQKLAIERLKYQFEEKKMKESSSKEIRVVLSDELLEWAK